MRSLTYRERLFVDYYLGESSESAVDAARRAWYPSPEELGPRLLKKSAVQAAIAAGAGTAAITPNEVLARYADIAASDMRDFMAVDKNGGLKVDLKLSQQRDLGHLIKRVRIHKDGSQDIELEPRLPALAKHRRRDAKSLIYLSERGELSVARNQPFTVAIAGATPERLLGTVTV